MSQERLSVFVLWLVLLVLWPYNMYVGVRSVLDIVAVIRAASAVHHHSNHAELPSHTPPSSPTVSLHVSIPDAAAHVDPDATVSATAVSAGSKKRAHGNGDLSDRAGTPPAACARVSTLTASNSADAIAVDVTAGCLPSAETEMEAATDYT